MNSYNLKIKNLIKKHDLRILDIFLSALILMLFLFWILPNNSYILKYHFYTFYTKTNILKKENTIKTYFDESHSSCYFTKENQSNFKSCKNNNEYWSYTHKTCFCRTPQLI